MEWIYPSYHNMWGAKINGWFLTNPAAYERFFSHFRMKEGSSWQLSEMTSIIRQLHMMTALAGGGRRVGLCDREKKGKKESTRHWKSQEREVEREKVWAQNLHSGFSFTDVSLSVRLIFFPPQLLRDRSTVVKQPLSQAPILSQPLLLGTSEAKVQIPCL